MARFSELRTMVNTRLSAPVVQALLAVGPHHARRLADAPPRPCAADGALRCAGRAAPGAVARARALRRARGAQGSHGQKAVRAPHPTAHLLHRCPDRVACCSRT